MTGEFLQARLPQQDFDKILRQISRYQEAATAHRIWSRPAVECVDFYEGEQWSDEDKKFLAEEGRPILTFNKIAPLIRLVLGYERQNRYDIRAMPGNDSASSNDVATALSQTFKQIATQNRMEWSSSEVFRDGLQCGRGYFDVRMDYSRNIFGDIAVTVQDPFSVYPDPHNDDYDINKGEYVQVSRWLSLQAIEQAFGKMIRDEVDSYRTSYGHSLVTGGYGDDYEDDLSPARFFAQITTFEGSFTNDFPIGPGRDASSIFQHFDPVRKTVRVIDMQHYVLTRRRFFVDLQTGKTSVIPDDFDHNKIVKLVDVAAQYGNELDVVEMMDRRCAWTITAGPLILYDEWSDYETFTVIPYFGYFRRGKTLGLVHDLRDPQREINKRRSAEIDIVSRIPHSGWIYHQKGLDVENTELLEEFGASPGINIAWKGENYMKPERINPSPPPTAMERLEERATADLKEISGVNDSALGQIDRVQSGRAIEARQRQTVIAIEPYLDNMARTRHLLGEKMLNLVQRKYTEERLVRVIGEGGEDQEVVHLNARDTAGRIINDVTVGVYMISIEESPASSSFLQGQFEEALDLLERGVPIPADILIDLSSMPRKTEIKQRIQQAQKAQQAPEGAAPEGGGASPPVPAPGNVVPIGGAR